MGIYKDAIRSLVAVCESFLQGECGIDELKAAVWNSASNVIALEERNVRDLLLACDAELDSATFTLFGKDLEAAYANIASMLITRFRDY